MKSRSQLDYKRAYADTFKFFRDMGHSPKYHRMDNETSSLIENYLENELDIPALQQPTVLESRGEGVLICTRLQARVF